MALPSKTPIDRIESVLGPERTHDTAEMVLGAPVLHTRSKLTGQPIIINKPGGSPFDGQFHEETEKQILAGQFDYAVGIRVLEGWMDKGVNPIDAINYVLDKRRKARR